MDNLTHSLIGISAGECFYQSQLLRPVSKCKLTVSRSALIFASVAANNIPDSDVILGKFIKPPFGYLLQHRGFTHTLLGALPQALFVTALTYLILRLGRVKLGTRDLLWVFLVGVVGVGLHIFADSWNSYGVHPFWPFNNKWYYGDSVFIAEPWIWITFAASLFWISTTWLGKTCSPLLALLAFGLTSHYHLLPWKLGLAMAVWYAGVSFVVSKFSKAKAGFVGFGIFLFSILIFLVEGHFIKSQIRDIAWQTDPESKLYDTIISPMPANFLCWYVVTVESLGKPEIYKLSSGFFSLAPLTSPPESCSRFPFGKSEDIKFAAKKPNQDPRIAWTQSFKTPAEKMRKVYADDCRVQAYFKFARAPFIQSKKDNWILGDYRYERPGVSSFSHLTFPKSPIECPRHLPPWVAPRLDFIEAR